MKTLQLTGGRVIVVRLLNADEQRQVQQAIQTAARGKEIPHTGPADTLAYMGKLIGPALAPYISGMSPAELEAAFEQHPNDARIALGVACGAIGNERG